jgi:hypothetical protein
MAEMALRPRSVTEILDASISLLRRDYIALVTVMALVSLPLLVSSTVWRLAFLEANQDAMNVGGTPVDMSGLWIPVLGWLLWYPVIDAALTLAASDAYLGRKVVASDVFQRLFPRIVPVIVAAVLKSVAILAGLILLFFPGAYLFLRFLLVPATVVLEDLSATGSINRSAELTRGHLLRILGAMLLVFVIYTILSMVVSLPTAILGSNLLTSVVEAVVTVFLYPMVPVTVVVIYYDLRIRKEGFDIELMSQALTPSPAGIPPG